MYRLICLKAKRECLSLSTLPSIGCRASTQPGSQCLQAPQTKSYLLLILTAIQGTGIRFLIGVGTSSKGRCSLGGICLNLRCLLGLDVMHAICLPAGASTPAAHRNAPLSCKLSSQRAATTCSQSKAAALCRLPLF